MRSGIDREIQIGGNIAGDAGGLRLGAQRNRNGDRESIIRARCGRQIELYLSGVRQRAEARQGSQNHGTNDDAAFVIHLAIPFDGQCWIQSAKRSTEANQDDSSEETTSIRR